MKCIQLFICIVLLSVSNFSMIQTSFAADTEAVLEEIIVTSQRREQGVQDVPIAITAMTGAFLAEIQIL